ncbi:hypothetical protein CR51_10200 [Caballeronia megalochromosomata]|nr:hypothetical protein CR51_10200 [Caballeronia megalochromosomata]
MMLDSGADSVCVCQWFVHQSENNWFITINERRDHIRSVGVELSGNPMVTPLTVVAELWPLVRAQGIEFDCDALPPLYVQSEIRVLASERHFWLQAGAWIWQEGRVVAYRSHPAIVSRASSIPDACAGELAERCFNFASTFELELGGP